jgi:hypothetical protein
MAATRRSAKLIVSIVVALLPWAADAQPASQAAAPLSRPAVAGSLGDSKTNNCAALRAKYMKSQACFEHYRLAGGGLKAEAFKHCQNVIDPSPQCGPDLPTK